MAGSVIITTVTIGGGKMAIGKRTIQISEELHHFLTINATSKNETYDQIIRRLFRSGLKFAIGEAPSTESVEGGK